MVRCCDVALKRSTVNLHKCTANNCHTAVVMSMIVCACVIVRMCVIVFLRLLVLFAKADGTASIIYEFIRKKHLLLTYNKSNTWRERERWTVTVIRPINTYKDIQGKTHIYTNAFSSIILYTYLLMLFFSIMCFYISTNTNTIVQLSSCDQVREKTVCWRHALTLPTLIVKGQGW